LIPKQGAPAPTHLSNRTRSTYVVRLDIGWRPDPSTASSCSYRVNLSRLAPRTHDWQSLTDNPARRQHQHPEHTVGNRSQTTQHASTPAPTAIVHRQPSTPQHWHTQNTRLAISQIDSSYDERQRAGLVHSSAFTRVAVPVHYPATALPHPRTPERGISINTAVT